MLNCVFTTPVKSPSTTIYPPLSSPTSSHAFFSLVITILTMQILITASFYIQWKNILFPKHHKNIKHIGINLKGKIENLHSFKKPKFFATWVQRNGIQSPETISSHHIWQFTIKVVFQINRKMRVYSTNNTGILKSNAIGILPHSIY